MSGAATTAATIRATLRDTNRSELLTDNINIRCLAGPAVPRLLLLRHHLAFCSRGLCTAHTDGEEGRGRGPPHPQRGPVLYHTHQPGHGQGQPPGGRLSAEEGDQHLQDPLPRHARPLGALSPSGQRPLPSSAQENIPEQCHVPLHPHALLSLRRSCPHPETRTLGRFVTQDNQQVRYIFSG